MENNHTLSQSSHVSAMAYVAVIFHLNLWQYNKDLHTIAVKNSMTSWQELKWPKTGRPSPFN